MKYDSALKGFLTIEDKDEFEAYKDDPSRYEYLLNKLSQLKNVRFDEVFDSVQVGYQLVLGGENGDAQQKYVDPNKLLDKITQLRSTLEPLIDSFNEGFRLIES